MRWRKPEGIPVLLDPCAGEGEAISTLRDLWAVAYGAPLGRDPWAPPLRPSVVACEIEESRARTLQAALDETHDRAYHADAFRLLPGSDGTAGATVLYLNPPYDYDRDCGRLEHRFLVRFTRHLAPGGALLFFVPFYALAASAEFLAAHYRDLRAWRLPEPEFQAFRQALLVARRVGQPLPSNLNRQRIEAWARDPERLPVLPERCPEPLAVEGGEEGAWGLSYSIEATDLPAALEAFRPWEGTPTGVALSARDLLGARFATAVPPKPAHIALALASGMINGHPIEPDDPTRHPTLLAKGVFERTPVRVSETTDAKGAITSAVEIEVPRLRLTVLRLDEASFHTLAAGTVATGSPDLTAWNVADLLVHYGRSLARLLARQFPPLHDPAKASEQIRLPALARRPFAAQAQAITAALKLLATGRNPVFDAEVGTGKSTMALYVAAALSPEHRPATVGELRRLGFTGKLPVVRRALILCPPHLLASWRDQVAAVLPEARVVTVERPADLKREAEFYLVSRETAKLGHAVEGVAGRCPRCGAPVEEEPATNASRRLRCKAVARRATNLAARLAEDLAVLLAPGMPEDETATALVRGRVVARKASASAMPDDETATALARGRVVARTLSAPAMPGDETATALVRGRVVACTVRAEAARPLPVERLLGFFEDIAWHVQGLFEEGLRGAAAASTSLYALVPLLGRLARALGRQGELIGLLARLLDGTPADHHAVKDPLRWERQALEAGRCEANPAPLDEAARRALLRQALHALYEAGQWQALPPCGEPLFRAVPRPRRYPLAKLILRRYRHSFDLVLLDELHEFNRGDSAQAKAAHRLAGLPGVPAVALTGSLMGGYASSLFPNFWALSPGFRREFGRQDQARFVARYGYLKTLVTPKEGDGSRSLGAHTDRELEARRVIGEAPGVLPTFIMRHLLPTAVVVHKQDLEADLPPLAEIPVVLTAPAGDALAGELLAEYRRLERTLLDRIKKDRFAPNRAGRLLGALVGLPSYLDRATADLPPFALAYPDELGGEVIATGRQFPAEWTTPKERWLLEQVRGDLGRGEKVLVFLRHTGTAELPRRLLRLLGEITPRVAWLDAKKVPTARREAWIRQHVLDRGVEVLLVNPNAVRTGLNCLVAFSTGIWHQLDYSATTWRQANGRLHRIGQTRPVSIHLPYYAGTAQQVAMELVAKKITTSLQVDGLDLEAALEAAGASPERAASVAAAMSFGQAVYEALMRSRPGAP